MVQANHLTAKYGKRCVFQDISFHIASGELCALLGVNGAGKTTLLKILAGLRCADSGELCIAGRPAICNGMMYEQTAYLQQGIGSLARLTVYEALLTSVKCESFFVTNEDRRKTDQIIEQFRLTDIENHELSALSGGQLQMVQLAQAIGRNKKILLFDEPAMSLDYYHQLFVLKTVQKTVKENGCSAIVSMHDVNLAAMYADKVLVLSNGALYAFAEPEKVISAEMMRDVFHVDCLFFSKGNVKFLFPKDTVPNVLWGCGETARGIN